MKKYSLLPIFVILFINLMAARPAQAQSSPTQIHNCQDLQNINNNLASNYLVVNDIDCSKFSNFQPIGGMNPFTGGFDGQGHTIKGVMINVSNSSNAGLFSTINTSAPVGNVTLDSFNIKGGAGIGALAGEITLGNISNVIVSNAIIYPSINGGGSGVGGITGEFVSGVINDSAVINTNITGSPYTSGAGGLVGNAGTQFTTAQIIECYSTGEFTGSAMGGLVGILKNGEISNSYSLAHLNGTLYVGGLIGIIETDSPETAISDSFAAGPIEFGARGVVGINNAETGVVYTVNTYWDTQATGQSIDSLTSTQGETTGQMYSQSTYAGWDFVSTWVSDNKNYPILKWQEQPRIDLWNTFSASSQESVFEPASPSNVYWATIDNANAAGVNWSDLLVLSRPAVWNYQSAVPQSGYLNSVNWTTLSILTQTNINWSDVGVMSRTGINWASVDPVANAGINWNDWVVLTQSAINWNDFVLSSNSDVNWETLSIKNKAGINWADWSVLSKSQINWFDVSVLSNTGINWDSVGSLIDPINIQNFASLTKQGINWNIVDVLSEENVNWDNPAVLNAIPMTTTDLQTLRTIVLATNGNSHQGPPTGVLTLNLTGKGTGDFTSSPAGINCSGSGPGCSAVFPLNQPITIISDSTNSLVTNWGGCAPTSEVSCTVTLDQSTIINIAVNPSVDLNLNVTGNGYGNFSVTAQSPYGLLRCSSNPGQPWTTGCTGNFLVGDQLTIAAIPVSGSTFGGWTGIPGCSSQTTCTFTINSSINASAQFNLIPTYTITTSESGPGTGVILCNGSACAASVPAGTTITFTAQPSPGSVWSGWEGTYCTASGGSNVPCTILNINTNISVEAYFTLAKPAINLSTYGAGSGTILCNGFSCPTSVSTGTSITFTTVPKPGSVFESWGNTCTDSGGAVQGTSCVINNITSNVNLTAYLGVAPPTYTITTGTAGPGKGSVLCNGSACPASVPSGTALTFTAEPAKGSILTGLGGICAAPGGPIYTCSVDITSDTTISAYFIKSPPPAPTALHAVKSSSGITLSWSNKYGVSFNVYRAEAGVNGNKYALIKSVGYPNDTYIDNTMPNDGTYDYYVTGVYYPNIESPKSNVVSISWKDLNVPSTPTGLTVATSKGQVTLSWNTSLGADSYDVKRAVMTESGVQPREYSIIAQPASNPTKSTTSFKDSMVVNAKTYYYIIAAHNDDGTSAYTLAVSIKAE